MMLTITVLRGCVKNNSINLYSLAFCINDIFLEYVCNGCCVTNKLCRLWKVQTNRKEWGVFCSNLYYSPNAKKKTAKNQWNFFYIQGKKFIRRKKTEKRIGILPNPSDGAINNIFIIKVIHSIRIKTV